MGKRYWVICLRWGAMNDIYNHLLASGSGYFWISCGVVLVSFRKSYNAKTI